jgi:hypothetical protein
MPIDILNTSTEGVMEGEASLGETGKAKCD